MEYHVEAERYTKAKDFHYVKVLINNDMYISGIKVRESIKFPGELWVQMPSYKIGTKWKRYVEFPKNSTLYEGIQNSINNLLEDEILGNAERQEGVEKSYSADDEPPDLSDIPF